MFFTRLPWWRLHQPQQEAFAHAAEYWPFAGWLTGGAMALSFYLGVHVLPLSLAILLCIGVRLLLTGALHEDGLADFCDGMGGGCGRERILAIMKDSHIGTYGVLGLIVYFLFLFTSLREMAMGYLSLSLLHKAGQNPIALTCATIFTADVLAKCAASLLITQLPYARTQQEAKSKVVYKRMDVAAQALRIAIALVPVFVFWGLVESVPHPIVLVLPFLVQALLALWMRARLKGYTGDCCGATFLLCEASIYLGWMVLITSETTAS